MKTCALNTKEVLKLALEGPRVQLS